MRTTYRNVKNSIHDSEFTFSTPFKYAGDGSAHLSTYAKAHETSLRGSSFTIPDYALRDQTDMLNRSAAHDRSRYNTAMLSCYLLDEEHRAETERLLVEVSRLNDTIYELERSKRKEAHVLRYEFETTLYVQTTQLKQAHAKETDRLMSDFKRTKQELTELQDRYDALATSTSREKSFLLAYNYRFKAQIKETIENKAEYLCKLRSEKDAYSQKIAADTQQELKEVRLEAQKQIESLKQQLDATLADFDRERKFAEQYRAESDRIIKQLQTQIDQLEERNQRREVHQQNRYDYLKKSLQELHYSGLQESENKLRFQAEIFYAELVYLKKVIYFKESEVKAMQYQSQTREELNKKENYLLYKQSSEIHQRFMEQYQSHQRELEELKVKMALLHESDMETVRSYYSKQMETASMALGTESARLFQAQQELVSTSERGFNVHKQLQINQSVLKESIIKLKMDVETVKRECKQRIAAYREWFVSEVARVRKEEQLLISSLQNSKDEKQMLERTIATLTRDAYMTEKLMNERQNTIEQERIKANNKIQSFKETIRDLYIRLSNQQKTYLQELETLRNEVTQLNEQLSENVIDPNEALQGYIIGLNEELERRLIEIGDLKDYKGLLHQQVYDVKRTYEYEQKRHLKELKTAYEREKQSLIQQRTHELGLLDSDKQQLRSINMQQYNTISELLKKCKDMEKALEAAAYNLYRRNHLHAAIIGLGLDQNLVTSKAKLFQYGRSV